MLAKRVPAHDISSLSFRKLHVLNTLYKHLWLVIGRRPPKNTVQLDHSHKCGDNTHSRSKRESVFSSSVFSI